MDRHTRAGPTAKSVLRRIRNAVKIKLFDNSATYWQRRYANGGNSGAGSYGKLADFKAETINDFVSRHGVASVIEFGCGDGNQLSLAHYPTYIGVDAAPRAVDICRERFGHDPSKAFLRLNEYEGERADLALSLDVILHLVEDDVFADYIERLFSAADRFVGVFAENLPDHRADAHVRYRPILAFIGQNQADWKLGLTVDNPYIGSHDTFANFYFFMRRSPID